VIPHLGPLPNTLPTPISTFSFDNLQELLWVGSQYGRVLSFYSRELQRYTSYKAHNGEAVHQLLFHEKGVISLSSQSIHMAQRTGVTIWHLTDVNFRQLQCMSYTAKGTNELLVAGLQEQMFKIDIERGQIIEYVGIYATNSWI
jgi:PAB-dependent poly(A)-specific ribonuclease subunit 2